MSQEVLFCAKLKAERNCPGDVTIGKEEDPPARGAPVTVHKAQGTRYRVEQFALMLNQQGTFLLNYHLPKLIPKLKLLLPALT